MEIDAVSANQSQGPGLKAFDADALRAVNKTADGFNPASFDNTDNRSDSDESKFSKKRSVAMAMDHTRKRLNRTAGPEDVDGDNLKPYGANS